MNRFKKILLIILALLGILFGYGLYKSVHTVQRKKQPLDILSYSADNTETPHFTAENFDLDNILKGFTKKQIVEHEALYHGYVKKRNEITEKLRTVDRSNATSITYSPYRALKIAQTFAMNGDILHRLYFGNLGKTSNIGPQMKELIEESFGSIESYQADLFAAGKSSRGWVITAYTLDSGLIENYVLDAHNLTVPMMVMPLLVLDVYEHAYMIDFGINRGKYLNTFWQNINWDVIEERIDKWVKPFQEQIA